MALWQATEWESISGWHCNCVSDLGHDSAVWWHPARILGITPAEFIRLLLKEYKPDSFYINPETCFCCWSWDKQSDMRLFKNWINREARKKNYQI